MLKWCFGLKFEKKMTEHQLNKANRLKDERDDIQNLINFLSDQRNVYRFGLEIVMRYKFMKFFSAGAYRKEFSCTTKRVIIDALIKQRDNLTKQIEEL
jgi:hypothetical protein